MVPAAEVFGQKRLCSSPCHPHRPSSLRHDLDTGCVAAPNLAQDVSVAGRVLHSSSHHNSLHWGSMHAD